MAYWGTRFTPIGVIAVVQGYRNFNNTLRAMQRDVAGFGAGLPAVAQPFVGLGNTVISTTARMAVLGGAALAGLSFVVGGLGASAVGASRDYESAFAGVLKTTEGLEDEQGNLNAVGKELRQGFRDMAKEIPTTADELANIGAVAGQLGVEYSGTDKSLLHFTRTVADLGVTTNLTTEEGAFALARFANVFGIETADMGSNAQHVGSTIVDLGNNFATTERDIIKFATRVGGAGKITGFTQSDVLGIAAALSSLGVQAEAGGTATQKTMLAINTAVASAGQTYVDNSSKVKTASDKIMDLTARLMTLEAQTGVTGESMWQMYEDFEVAQEGLPVDQLRSFGEMLGDQKRAALFKTYRDIQYLHEEIQSLQDTQGMAVDKVMSTIARVSGISVAEFRRLWKEDASEAFKLFVRGIAEQGDDAALVFKDLKLNNERLIRAFLGLSGAGDLLDRTLDKANTAWDENTALTIEAEKRYRTTDSKIQIFKNTINDLAITFGDYLLPVLADVMDAFQPLLTEVAIRLPGYMEETLIPAVKDFTTTLKDLITTLADEGLKGILKKMGLSDVELEFLGKIREGIIGLAGDIRRGLGDAVSWFSTNVLPRLDEALRVVIDNWDIFRGMIVGVLAVIGGSVILAIINSLIGAIAAISVPVLAVMAAAAALGAVWTTNFGGIRDFMADLWDNKLKPIFESINVWLVERLPGAVTWLGEFFAPVWEHISAAFQETVEALKPLIDEFIQFLPTLKTIAIVVGGILLVGLRILGHAFAVMLPAAVRTFVQVVILLLRTVTNIVNGLIGLKNIIVGIFTGNRDLVRQGMQEVIDAVRAGIGDVITFLQNMGGIVWSAIVSGFLAAGIDIPLIVANIRLALDSFVAGVQSNFITPITEGIGSVIKFFTDLWATISTTVSDVAGAVAEFLAPVITLFATWGRTLQLIGQLVASVFGLIGSIGGVVFRVLAALVGKVVGWFGKMGDTLSGPLSTAIDTINTTVFPAFQTAWKALYDAVKPVYDTLDFISTLIGETIISAIDAWITKTKTDFINALNLLVGETGLLTILNNVLNSINDVLQWVIDKINDFKSALDNLTLPSWLESKSPTPLELGLLGIAEAFGIASAAAAHFGSTFAEMIIGGVYGQMATISSDAAKAIWNPLYNAIRDGMRKYVPTGVWANLKEQFHKAFSELQLPATATYADAFIAGLNLVKEKYLDMLQNPTIRNAAASFLDSLKATASEALGSLAQMQATTLDIVDELSKAFGTLSSLGSKAADMFTSALEDIKKIDAEISEIDFLMSIGAGGDVARMMARRNELAAQRAVLEARVGSSLESQEDIQREILRMEEARSKLDFLKAQYDVIKMVREMGLDMSQVFANIKFGLDANLTDIITAMAAAMEEIVNQVNKELQIHSESKVFRYIGKMMRVGMEKGWRDTKLSVAGIVPRMNVATSTGVVAPANNYSSIVNDFSGMSVASGMDVSILQTLITQAVARAMRA